MICQRVCVCVCVCIRRGNQDHAYPCTLHAKHVRKEMRFARTEFRSIFFNLPYSSHFADFDAHLAVCTCLRCWMLDRLPRP
jgi:hypothetical protein